MIYHDLQANNGCVDWVDQLPVYQNLYNTRPHRAFGGTIINICCGDVVTLCYCLLPDKFCPFTIFFGRPANTITEALPYRKTQPNEDSVPPKDESPLSNHVIDC